MNDPHKILPLYPQREYHPDASRLTAAILDELGIDPLVPDLPQRVLDALSESLADANWMTRLEAVKHTSALAYHACQALLRATRDEVEPVQLLAHYKLERIQALFLMDGNEDNILER